ncbi:diguanylate cyclase [Aquicoccus sp. SCR17]|nr:diguanylate cyclase [Carideicomes alvinocaridis]
MHLRLDPDGRISHAGPAFRKLCPGRSLVGCDLFDLLDWRRRGPAGALPDEEGMTALLAAAGEPLKLRLRAPPGTGFKGVLAADGQGGGLLNLSFGISVVEAVRDHALTSRDLAPTDLTIEMLYLVEAKTAAMEASRDLNLRLQGAKIAAEEQAFTDTLTGLKNRRAMDHVLERLTAAGVAAPFALMHLDLDYFKQVNDRLGHAAGDHVLQQVARILVEETRSGDVVARVGGDEFVIVFGNLTGRERLEQAASRIIARLEQPIPYGGKSCRVSASAGSALSGCYARPDGVQMLIDADTALYVSKRRGRGQHTFFHEELR